MLLLFSSWVVSDIFATSLTIAPQAPLSMGFLRQEYWSGLPFPSPEDLPNPGIKPASPVLQAKFLPLNHQGNPNQHYVFILSLFVQVWVIVYADLHFESLSNAAWRRVLI